MINHLSIGEKISFYEMLYHVGSSFRHEGWNQMPRIHHEHLVEVVVASLEADEVSFVGLQLGLPYGPEQVGASPVECQRYIQVADVVAG